MSIQVRQLTKQYGAQKAIDGLDFEVAAGQVVGFLGPNGAGKTTTMKIISGCLRATAGNASVCGFDVEDDPMEVRRRVGYLAEHNPLYLDMYVREYLAFVASLYRLDRRAQRVEDVIARTGLGLEAHKRLHMLSKGYRQRVGLAQAMIHDPEVLILDEPTSGLDPNQLVEIRDLIRELGQEKTVLFSTHIMQEVQAVCDRVVIINRGHIVADGSIGMLTQHLEKESAVEVEFSREVNPQTLKKLPGLTRLEQVNPNRFICYGHADADLRPVLFDFAVGKSLKVLEMFPRASTVEDVFQQLTKQAAS
jgi:ABC-2 type transport system ATP-binding protein